VAVERVGAELFHEFVVEAQNDQCGRPLVVCLEREGPMVQEAIRTRVELDDHVATWRCAWEGLADGGRFVEIDIDPRDPDSGIGLLRYKTTRYLAHEQRADIRFRATSSPTAAPWIGRPASSIDSLDAFVTLQSGDRDVVAKANIEYDSRVGKTLDGTTNIH
jgi:hypothetical protein